MHCEHELAVTQPGTQSLTYYQDAGFVETVYNLKDNVFSFILH